MQGELVRVMGLALLAATGMGSEPEQRHEGLNGIREAG